MDTDSTRSTCFVTGPKLAVLNIIAAALGGAQTRIGALHTTLAREIGGGVKQATLIGDGARVSRPIAAYANGSLAFALDYEDVCQYVIHAGPIVIPAALALAEAQHSSGKDFLTSVVLGYEVGTRIGRAMQPTPARGAQVWGQQYTPFAACVAAGRFLRLTPVEMDVAFGITLRPGALGLQIFWSGRRNASDARSKTRLGLDVHGWRGGCTVSASGFPRWPWHSGWR